MNKDKLLLSGKEKEMLRRLKSEDFSYDNFHDFTQAEINAAAIALDQANLIIGHFSEERGLEYACLSDEGMAYLSDNPLLKDPVSKEIEILTKKNLELQNLELEYKLRIKRQEDIIRLWQLISAVLGIIGLGGWLVLVF